MKCCKACGEFKPFTEFHRSARSPDGYRPRCKSCRAGESNDHYLRNAERIKANTLRWKAEHPEASRENDRRYKRSAKGRATARARAERPDVRAKARAAYAANPGPWKARARARQALKRGLGSEVFEYREVFDRDGWVCQLCLEPVDPVIQFPDPRSASLDHIIPLSVGGDHTRANSQCSHLSCNRSKGARPCLVSQ